MLLLNINMFFHNNHRSSQDMTRWWVTPGEDPKRCNPVCYIHIHQRITLIDLVCILRAHPDITPRLISQTRLYRLPQTNFTAARVSY